MIDAPEKSASDADASATDDLWDVDSGGPCHKVLIYVTGDSHKCLCGDQFVPAWGVKTVAKDPLLVVGSKPLDIPKPPSWIKPKNPEESKEKEKAKTAKTPVAEGGQEDSKESKESKDSKGASEPESKDSDPQDSKDDDMIHIQAPCLVLFCDPLELRGDGEGLGSNTKVMRQIGTSKLGEYHGHESIAAVWLFDDISLSLSIISLINHMTITELI
jgi:hypothetical protein